MKKLFYSLLIISVFLSASYSDAAITTAHLTNGGSSSTAASAITSSTTPTADSLVLVSVGTTAASFTAPTITGNGMTWVVVATSTNGGYNMSVLRGLSASPSAGAMTIDFAGNDQTRIGWTVEEFASVNTGGSNGSAAVVQSNTTSSSMGDTNLTPAIALSTFGTSTNAAFGAIVGATNVATLIAPGAGMTELTDFEIRPASGINLQDEWKSTSTTSVAWTFTGGTSMDGAAAVALEIAGTPTSTVSVTTRKRIITFFDD